MDLIIFERKAFEEFATKIEQFILRVSNSPVVKSGKKKTNNWLDHQDVCQRLKISKRTLQTLRDNGTLAYTKIGNRTYYLPEDVESIITKVEDKNTIYFYTKVVLPRKLTISFTLFSSALPYNLCMPGAYAPVICLFELINL